MRPTGPDSREGEADHSCVRGAYLAFNIRALAAGVLATYIVLRATSVAYGGFVASVAVATLAFGRSAFRAGEILRDESVARTLADTRRNHCA